MEASGEEAVWEMRQFGIDHGISGGTFYQLTDARDRHPGLLDDQSRLQVRQLTGDALKRYHADVEVGFVRRLLNILCGKKMTLTISQVFTILLNTLKVDWSHKLRRANHETC